MASIVCPSCGIKVRASRERCPRCRQPLAAAAPAPARAISTQPQPLLQPRSKAVPASVAAAVVLIAGLAGFAFWRSGDPRASFPVSAPQVAVAKTPAPPPAAPTTTRPRLAVTSDQFIEPAQGARVAYASGDYAAAVSQYEAAVAQRPNDAESWNNLGQALVKLDRAKEAIEKFERAIDLNPDRWSYHFNFARAQGLLGNWESAVEQYKAAFRLFPDDYATAFNLGLALRKAGDDSGAVDAFKRAIELDPQDPTFHFSLAGSYEKLGQVADAIAEYQRTLELAGAAPEVPAIQARISRLKGESSSAPAAAPARESAPAPGSGR